MLGVMLAIKHAINTVASVEQTTTRAHKEAVMTTLNKTFWLSAGAAIGAGLTYYLLNKSRLDDCIRNYAEDGRDKTKEHGQQLVEKVDDYFEESERGEKPTA